MSALPQPGGSERNRRRVPDREKPCQQWMKGQCQLGNTCKFRHAEKQKGRVKNVQTHKKEDSEMNKPGSATNLGGSASLTGSAGFVLTQTTSTGGKVADSTQLKGKEKVVDEKEEKHNVNHGGSGSDVPICGDWKRGKCARGNKCRYKHDSPQGGITQVPNTQVKNEPSRSQNFRGNNSARPNQAEKTTKLTEGVSPQTRNLALPQSGRSRKEDVLDKLRAAIDDAREAGQRDRQQASLIEERHRRREQALVVERESAEREVAQREAALREEENRRRGEASAKAKEGEEKAAKEVREAAQREQLALIEEENRRKEEAMAIERAEKEARQQEAVLREEETRRREKAQTREAKAKVAKEAREAAKRERLASIEEENRRNEEALEIERVEREVRQQEAALREEKNRRREEAIARAKEAKARAAKEVREAKKQKQALKREAIRKENVARIARERAEREARIVLERAAREAREEAERKRQREITTQREKEAATVEQYLVSETSLVTCSAGFNIQHVIPGFELCRIVIRNLPRNATREEIVDIFIQQGVQPTEFMLFQVKVIGNKQEAVVLANAEHGEAISLGLDGIEFRDEVLNFSVSDNASWSASGMAAQNIPFIIVSWRIPGETIVVNYPSMEEAQRKIRELDKSTWNGRQINAKTNDPPRHGDSQNFVSKSIRVFNCPLGSAFDNAFHEFIGSYHVKALKSNTTFNFQDSFNFLRQHVAGLAGVRVNTYQVLKRGDQADGEVKVKIEFDDWEDAKLVHATIDKQRMGTASPFYYCRLPKQLQHKMLQYKIVIPRHQYESQRKQWDALGEKKVVDDPYVQTRINRGGVFIEIVGKEKKTAGPLKVRVESMIAGEKLDSTLWNPTFATSSTKAFFDGIYKDKSVFVRSDSKTQALRVYGESNAVTEVRQMIREEVERLGQMETTRVLNQEWVGFFVQEGVGKLAELLGEENVKLDVQPRMCRVTIKGGEEANHYLQRLIDQARAAVVVDSALPGTGEAETCPVCYGDLSHPEQLGCGHSYCSGCLKHFLTSAVDNKTFPLLCIGNETACNVPVAIPFVHRFLPAQTFNNLVEAAFRAYLEQHQQDLKYCRTPDCKQIYRVRRTDKTALQCPACFSTICPSCDEEPHAGMTCEEQRIHRNPAEQERLNEELAASSGYKRCPSCRAMIEKTGGCNHMTCSCGAHICWKCMDVFGSADETYEHLRTTHGGIYEEAPAGVVVGDPWDQDFLGEQIEALARIERERLDRGEVLRRPMVAAANPFVGPYANYHEDIRRANDAWHENARRIREAAEAQEEARRIRAEEIYRQHLEEHQARMAEERQLRQLRLAQVAAQRQEEDRGWCILM